jgi:hypothetical protein
MGLGAGGKIRQKVYLDPYGLGAWDLQNFSSVWVHILNSEQYRAVTGLEPPPTPSTRARILSTASRGFSCMMKNYGMYRRQNDWRA